MAGRVRISVSFLLALVVNEVGAQALSSPYPMFEDTTPLELTIAAPFRALGRDDQDDRPEYDSVIEFVDSDGTNRALDIEIRIRGRSRLENCDFPPLSLDFPRESVEGTVFAGQNRLKLVTLCKRGNSYHDYLTHEFLIYRMFNELTNRSFRVRWATVEYVYTDTRRPRSKIEPAFLIEEDWEVAERLGMDVVETETLEIAELDAQYTALHSLFQFLIGNTDWAVLGAPSGDFCCHNGKVLGTDGGRHIVLSYDFDNSGLISAEYAVPNDILPISSVRQRIYRGFCAMNGSLDAAVQLVNQRRERLMALLDDDSLTDRARDRALDYVNDFYDIVNDPMERQEQINDRCRD